MSLAAITGKCEIYQPVIARSSGRRRVKVHENAQRPIIFLLMLRLLFHRYSTSHSQPLHVEIKSFFVLFLRWQTQNCHPYRLSELARAFKANQRNCLILVPTNLGSLDFQHRVATTCIRDNDSRVHYDPYVTLARRNDYL